MANRAYLLRNNWRLGDGNYSIATDPQYSPGTDGIIVPWVGSLGSVQLNVHARGAAAVDILIEGASDLIDTWVPVLTLNADMIFDRFNRWQLPNFIYWRATVTNFEAEPGTTNHFLEIYLEG